MRVVTLNLFTFLLLSARTGSEETGKQSSVGILDSLINKTLEGLRPHLGNVHVEYQAFRTGPQEIGSLEGHLRDVSVRDVDKFWVKVIDTTLLDVNNLTIVEEKLSAKGRYSVNGTLAFPLAKDDIHFYGDGDFRAELTNLSVSMKIKIRYESGKKVVKDLDVSVGLEDFKIRLDNLMGGGDLEEVFNRILNDVGLTVFNYYKGPFVDASKRRVRQLIDDILNANDDDSLMTPTCHRGSPFLPS